MVRFGRLFAGLVLLAASSASAQEAPITVIHAGTLLATPGSAPLTKQTLLVQDRKIVEIRPGFVALDQVKGATRLVDLSDRFVLPGLSDVHVHLSGMQDMDLNLQAVTISDAELALHAANHVRRMLQAGFTILRDVGDGTHVTFALKNAINKGVAEGPRLFVSGRLLSRTGGHGNDSVLLPAVHAALEKGGGCDSAETCRKIIREEVLRGADLIKIVTSGGARDEAGARDAPSQFFDDELDAIAAAARQLNRPIAAHAHSTAGINAALRAGARTIEHGTGFDDESVKLFKKNGAFLVPTAAVANYGLRMMENFKNKMSKESWDRARKITLEMRDNPGRAFRAGIKLGLGTDMGISAEIGNLQELEIFVDVGIPPAEAIKAATTNGAEIVGMGDRLGLLKPGYLADIIAVRGDPTQNIKALYDVTFVMKDGSIYRDDTARPAVAK